MKFAFINAYKIYAFTSKRDFLDQIKNKQKILIAMNAEKIIKDDSSLKEIVNANIGYPDGVGAVIALKQKGLEAVKIPGAELWLEIIKQFENEKSFFIMGSSSEVIEKTIIKLKNEFIHANILGYRDGYLKEGDKERLKKELRIAKPDMVFIAQGSPRQELLMEELMKEHPALYMGLGGSFDVYCGLKKRAPKIFCDYNLEWLYRLVSQPTRVFRQVKLLRFMLLYMTKQL